MKYQQLFLRSDFGLSGPLSCNDNRSTIRASSLCLCLSLCLYLSLSLLKTHIQASPRKENLWMHIRFTLLKKYICFSLSVCLSVCLSLSLAEGLVKYWHRRWTSLLIPLERRRSRTAGRFVFVDVIMPIAILLVCYANIHQLTHQQLIYSLLERIPCFPLIRSFSNCHFCLSSTSLVLHFQGKMSFLFSHIYMAWSCVTFLRLIIILPLPLSIDTQY